MIVVADTTPLNYLILIDEIELLPAIYRSILIPPEVHAELLSPYAPAEVRVWASSLPVWCDTASSAPILNPVLDKLDAGERAAIQLALHRGIDTVLLDDAEGRDAALHLNLLVAGTLGVLEKASQMRLIDFRSALARLETTNFRLADALRAQFLKRNP